jgi:hypothetical protein
MVARDSEENDVDGVQDLLQQIERDQLLVGWSRAQLVERLGTPATGAGVPARPDETAWIIGTLPAGMRGGPPTIFVRTDDSGCVTGVRVNYAQ